MSPVDKMVGERIKIRRTLLGFTQEYLGAVLKVSPQQIHKYETGTNRISVSRLLEIANLTDCPISYFVDQADDLKALPNDMMEYLALPNVIECIPQFATLTQTEQAALLDFMAALNRARAQETNDNHKGIGKSR